MNWRGKTAKAKALRHFIFEDVTGESPEMTETVPLIIYLPFPTKYPARK